ncbi:hypothetical protein BJY00DRAFT_279421 [Aspergillus carlsbadensis]|nr:hypothetical protein BJY00DRAFT_279421 [Aspergillus carlsbadensis]
MIKCSWIKVKIRGFLHMFWCTRLRMRIWLVATLICATVRHRMLILCNLSPSLTTVSKGWHPRNITRDKRLGQCNIVPSLGA